MVTVNNDTELNNELASDAGGKDIVLAEGVTFGYIALSGENYTTANTIRSENTANRSIIERFTTQNCANLIFQDVLFEFDGADATTDQFKFISIFNHDTITFTRCKFAVDQSGGPDITGNGLGTQNSNDITVTECEFQYLWGGITCVNDDVVTITDSNFHDIRTDCININDCDDVTIDDNYMHDSSEPQGGDHVDMIQIARGTDREQSQRIKIRRNVFDMGAGDNWGQTIHMGMDGKAQNAGSLHDDILIENNLVYQGHANAISFDWVDNVIIRQNSFMSGPAADIFSEPALKILNSDAHTVTVEDNIFCTNLSGSPAGWTMSDNYFLAESTYGTNFNELARSDSETYNDLEIKSGTSHHTALAGSRMQPREGGWGGNGMVPVAQSTWDYAGGFKATASDTKLLNSGGAPLILNGAVLTV